MPRTVDCSLGLYQGLRGRVSLGTLLWDQTSSLPGRLVGSLLFGEESQAGRPGAPLDSSHPRDCDKRKEVRSRALAGCKVPLDTGAGKVFPSLARVEKFLSVAERFCAMESPPAQLWQVILIYLALLERLVPHGRLQMRSLQWQLETHWSLPRFQWLCRRKRDGICLGGW